MTKLKRFGLFILAATMFFSSHEALADSQTFNSLFYKPAIGPNPYLMLDATQTLHKFQFDAGFAFSYAYHPMEIRQGGSRIRGFIDETLVGDFIAAFGILKWLQFGLDFPVVPIDTFADPLLAGTPNTKNHFTIGDLRFELKARVFDSCDKPVGLAVIPFITAPTGNATYYVGDPGITGGVKLALDGRVHENIGLTLNAGFQGGKKISLRNIIYQYQLLLGAGAQGIFSNGVGVFGEVNVKSATSHLFSDKDVNPAEFMAGASWDIKETGVTVQGGGGTCLVCGAEGAKIRAVVTAKYRFNPEKYKEMDREEANICKEKFGKEVVADELKELKIKCPENAADFNPGVDDASCPKYYELRQVADLVLRCPSKAADFNPAAHDAACPKVFALADTYSASEIQSIYTLSAAEMSILCPDNPADFNPKLNDVGCPKYYDLKEMVALSQKCPMSASEFREGVDDPSCPKFFTLKETYTPEQFNEFTLATAKEIDVLSISPKEIYGGEIKTLKPVYFNFDSVRIRPEDEVSIKRVIKIINGTPWVKRVRIDGHSDALGSSHANRKISRERAEAVVAYMKAHGVRSDVDLVSVPFGAHRPEAPNNTVFGRAKNRRVAFVVVGNSVQNGKGGHKEAAPKKKAAPQAEPESPDELAPNKEEPAEPADDKTGEETRKPRVPKRWR